MDVDEFEERGIVRLTGVFGEGDAAAMRAAAAEGIHAAKRDPSFLAILGPPLRELADALLGPGWRSPRGFGNVLVSAPDADRWWVPGREAVWHSDYAYGNPVDPLPMLRIFAVFGDVPPGGGGTLLVSGSHRMVARFVAADPATAALPAKRSRPACLASNEWLRELTTADAAGPDPARVERFMATDTDVDGIPARVVEACGVTGDVFVCHPWTIHCRPPHAGSQPRWLRSPTLYRRR